MFLLKNTTHRMVISYHPEFGHLWVPNQCARIPHERESGAYFVRTNAQGFRSDWDFTERKKDKARILFFGDSLTAGDGCFNNERFSDIVGRELGVETYNFGVSGSAPDQHLLIYRKIVENIQADLVVLCVFVENIERVKLAYRPTIERSSGLKRFVPKPYFKLDKNGQLELHHVPVPHERPEKIYESSANAESTAAKKKNLYSSFKDAFRLSDDIYSNKYFGKLFRTFSPKTIDDHTSLRSSLLKTINFQPYPDYASPESFGYRMLKKIIGEFASVNKRTPVLIVPIPSVYHYLDEVPPIYKEFYDSFSKENENVSVLDLTSELLKLPRHVRKTLPFKSDLHLSPRGHSIISEIMAKHIRKLNLIPQIEKSANPSSGPAIVSRSRNKACHILGISCFYHDSAASLITDGRIVAAVEEERFTRIKNDRNFPFQAINYCLEEAKIDISDLRAVVYYDNPFKTFERIMKTFCSSTDKSQANREMWKKVLPTWIQYKLHIPSLIRRFLKYDGEILCDLHHRSHAASSFFLSPFKSAAILSVDGVGEWSTATMGLGKGNRISIMREMRFPHSLGLLYSAFTQFTGFKVNSGEYKMMGLAPYGDPIYVDKILENVVRMHEDGSLELNMDYFSFCAESTMTSPLMAELFGGPPRRPEDRITKREMDIARSIQFVTEECLLKMAKELYRTTGEKRLCIAGGVALNCVANGRILRESPFEDIWIQPAAGDAGASLGAAFDVYHTYLGNERVIQDESRSQQAGSCWGPSFSDDEIKAFIETHNIKAKKYDAKERALEIAKAIAQGKVVGNFSGRTEFGPRALGSRSILGDPRNEEMQVKMNLQIKYRESFRPFAPVVLRDRVSDYFEMDRESPYMLLVAPVVKNIRKNVEKLQTDDMLKIVRQARSSIPAVTHVDYSARIQTIMREDNPEYYDIVKAFEELTSCAVMINTSFNVRGEPIVNTPEDAYRCFMRTEMDLLALGNYILLKADQPPWKGDKGHLEEESEQCETIPQQPEIFRDLEKIYDIQFLSLVKNLPPGINIIKSSSSKNTLWTPVNQPSDPKESFRFYETPVGKKMDTAEFAREIVAQWDDPEFGGKMTPLIAGMLDLLEKYPPPEQLDEEVSDSVYVMF